MWYKKGIKGWNEDGYIDGKGRKGGIERRNDSRELGRKGKGD